MTVFFLSNTRKELGYFAVDQPWIFLDILIIFRMAALSPLLKEFLDDSK